MAVRAGGRGGACWALEGSDTNASSVRQSNKVLISIKVIQAPVLPPYSRNSSPVTADACAPALGWQIHRLGALRFAVLNRTPADRRGDRHRGGGISISEIRTMPLRAPLPDQGSSIEPVPALPLRARFRRRVPLLLKILLVVAIAVGLALLFAQDQETLHIKSGVAADDPVFPDYVAALTGSGITRGDEYRILVNGVEIFPALLDAIRQARRRINFETYIYDTGTVAEEFTTALAAAAG